MRWVLSVTPAGYLAVADRVRTDVAEGQDCLSIVLCLGNLASPIDEAFPTCRLSNEFCN